MVGTKVRANRSLSYGEASLGEPKLASHPSAHGLGPGAICAITHQRPFASHLSIVGQRWLLEARPSSPASQLDRFVFNDAGGEPMSSRRSSWPACAGMTSVGAASC